MAIPKTHRHYLTSEDQAAAKNRAKNRALGKLEEREHLRLEIKTRDILQRLGAAVSTLIQGYEDIRTPVGDVIQVPLTRERIASLKAAADIDKTLLDRTLPALRPVELAQPEELLDNPSSLTDNALKALLVKYLQDSPLLADTPDFSRTLQ